MSVTLAVRGFAGALLLALTLPVHADVLWPAHGARFELTTDGPLQVDESHLVEWVNEAAEDIHQYLGHFPVDRVRVHVQGEPGTGGILGGQQFAGARPLIRVVMGALTDPAQLARDWVLTHEMAHLALPPLAPQHRWADEGMATYVESIARLRRGRLDRATVWAGFLRQMPGGLASARATGLDGSSGWASTYWGGAAFFLVADVRLRAQSGGRLGLEDALAALNRAGGTQAGTQAWPIEDVFRAMDTELGLDVLLPLYRSLGNRPFDYAMPELLARLGVNARGELTAGGSIAAIRQLIEQSDRAQPHEAGAAW